MYTVWEVGNMSTNIHAETHCTKLFICYCLYQTIMDENIVVADSVPASETS